MHNFMVEIEITPSEVQLQAAMQLASDEVHLANEPSGGPEAAHETYLNLSDSEVWVALVDSAVKGMIAFRVATLVQTARVDALAVDPGAREASLRIGSTLLGFFEDEMAYRGIGHITLESLPDAIAFYERQLYTKVGAGREFEKWLS